MASSRLAELSESLPPTTLIAITFLLTVYLVQIILDPSLNYYTLNPSRILAGEIHRLFTSSVLHASLMHIAMNGMSLVGIGSILETSFGTLKLAITIALSMLVSPCMYVAIAWIARVVFRYDSWMKSHAIGFSGILFHLSVLEAYSHSRANRSVLGIVQVPSRLYPWTLLVILQIFMPNLSFLGHLSGILTGFLQYYGVFDFIFPSSVTLQTYDSRLPSFCTERQNFVATPDVALGTPTESAGDVICKAAAALWLYVGYIMETVFVILLGRRGRSADTNTIAADDDEEWVGLPPADHNFSKEEQHTDEQVL
mmetsp:Transcript_18650/g.28198  ORF Transcript_18650/g.28198 Transcript_18650/m.28198 type:complete len:311 (+) Transcript_18650:67-999(+)